MGEQRQQLLEMEPAPGEDDVKIVEMTTKNIEYYTWLIKQWQGFRELTPIVKEVLCVKCYQKHCMLQGS